MKTYITSYNQNICDICMIIYGTLDKLVKLMFDNNLSYTNSIVSGTRILYDANIIVSNLNFSTGF